MVTQLLLVCRLRFSLFSTFRLSSHIYTNWFLPFASTFRRTVLYREKERERMNDLKTLCFTLPKKITLPTAFELLFQVSAHRLFHESDIVKMRRCLVCLVFVLVFFFSVHFSFFFLLLFSLSNFPCLPFNSLALPYRMNTNIGRG